MTSSATPIRFGDVVKLSTKGADPASAIGFLESKGNEHLLVVPPIKAKDKKFHEAAFIITPTRCEKPPAKGTPLNYKQRFVLVMSSQFEEYSLNNKMNTEDTVGLQCRDVKGEMYLTIEKEGYTMEANVMDGDEGLDVVVVDSNRMRKKYNKKLASYSKNKCEFVSCGAKGKALSLCIVKQPEASATAQFVKTKIVRRRSTLTQAKADEVGRANRVGSDVSDGDALSPTSVASAPSPLAMAVATPIPESEASYATSSDTALVENASTSNSEDAAATSHASTAESTASNSEPLAVAAQPVAETSTVSDKPTAPVVDVLSDVTLEDKHTEDKHIEGKHTDVVADVPVVAAMAGLAAPMVEAPKTESTAAAAATESSQPASTAIETALEAALPPPTLATTGSATTESKNAQASTVVSPSPTKLGQKQQQQESALTLTSDAETTDDKVNSDCLGGNKCAIM